MSTKRKKYSISTIEFIEYLMSDEDDIIYWGKRFKKDLLEEGKISLTIHQIFKETDTLPAHLFENQMSKEEFYMIGEEDISTSEIKLI